MPENNTLRCYPVRWTPMGYQNPVTDYFHKYVVTKIYETDHTGGTQPNGSPRIAYSYDYIGDPAWRYNDDDGMVTKKDKTWSQWRGYFRYDYNAAGEISKIADIAAPGGADNQCFKDDYAGRLVEAWTPTSGDCAQPITNAALGGPAKYWMTWEYDKAGRRLSQVDHAAASNAGRTTTYQYPANNAANVTGTHMLQSTRTKVGTGAETQADYTYDETGNAKTRPTASAGTQALTWDSEGRRVCAGHDQSRLVGAGGVLRGGKPHRRADAVDEPGNLSDRENGVVRATDLFTPKRRGQPVGEHDGEDHVRHC